MNNLKHSVPYGLYHPVTMYMPATACSVPCRAAMSAWDDGIKACAPRIRGHVVLDVGCGAGAPLAMMAAKVGVHLLVLGSCMCQGFGSWILYVSEFWLLDI